MSEPRVVYEATAGVATLTLDHPPVNGYSHELMRALDDAILRARFDEDVHVILLTGAGEKFFCAGADIRGLAAIGQGPATKLAVATEQGIHVLDARLNPQASHANETLTRLEQTPKLVIAALNGHTVGGGLEVALACDLRVARAGGGKIGLPGSTQRLTRVLGRAKALELMVSGRNMTFEEGHDLGLVNEVLEGDFPRAAAEYARAYCPPNKASMAVGLIKRAVQSGADATMDVGLALERELQARLFASGDAREGLAAYVDKRKPDFEGS